MNKNYFFLIILIFFTFEVNSNETKVFIKKSVNEHIITNVDIDNEINFITTLNPNLANVDKKKINKYAEINLVNEKIKISELSKFYEINNSEVLSTEIIMKFPLLVYVWMLSAWTLYSVFFILRKFNEIIRKFNDMSGNYKEIIMKFKEL